MTAFLHDTPPRGTDHRSHSPSSETILPSRNHPKRYYHPCIDTIDFHHVKENLMRATRNHSDYPQPYTNQFFYADLFRDTMLQCKNLATIPKPLRNHQIQYKWGQLNWSLQKRTDPIQSVSWMKAYRYWDSGAYWNCWSNDSTIATNENHTTTDWDDFSPSDDMTTK